ncbi:MAG: hypothetical protein ACK5HT_05855 [Draconibacterium sp.]
MSNLADRRDKPEIERFRDIHLSELCSLLKLYESQELVCLINRAEGKIICMVEATESEGILGGKGESFRNLIEVDKPTLQNVWSDLQRLRKESKVETNGRRSTGRQVVLVFDTMLASMKKVEVSDFRTTLKDFYSGILPVVSGFNGKVLNSGSERFYVVFEFADEAIQCSSLLKEKFYALLCALNLLWMGVLLMFAISCEKAETNLETDAELLVEVPLDAWQMDEGVVAKSTAVEAYMFRGNTSFCLANKDNLVNCQGTVLGVAPESGAQLVLSQV